MMISLRTTIIRETSLNDPVTHDDEEKMSVIATFFCLFIIMLFLRRAKNTTIEKHLLMFVTVVKERFLNNLNAKAPFSSAIRKMGSKSIEV